jgi:hypothetical protein
MNKNQIHAKRQNGKLQIEEYECSAQNDRGKTRCDSEVLNTRYEKRIWIFT